MRTMSAGVANAHAAGINAEPVDARIEAVVAPDWMARNALDVLKMSIDVLCRRAVLEVEDLRSAIERVRPDAVIIDANCWGAMSAADADDLPWLVFSPFTPYLRSPGVPPFGPGLRPLPGVVGRLRDASVRPIVPHLFDRRIVPRVNAVRAAVGAPTVSSVDELMRRAPLLLAVGGEPFEYPHSGWGDAVHLVGACVFEPATAPVPEWVAAIDRPIVLVSTSSIKQADTVLACTALQALANEPVHVVATFPAGVPQGLPTPPTPQCANSFRTVRCSIARAVRSPMAGWARRSRPSTAVCRSASFRSLAIRPRSRVGWRWLAVVSGYRPTNSARRRCANLFEQR